MNIFKPSTLKGKTATSLLTQSLPARVNCPDLELDFLIICATIVGTFAGYYSVLSGATDVTKHMSGHLHCWLRKTNKHYANKANKRKYFKERPTS
jgi:hypothetical protein